MSEQFTVKVEHGPDDLVELVTLPIEYANIATNVLDSLLRYMLWGDKRFGDFIRACLLNDLQRAFARWDGENWQAFYMVVKFIYNRLPSAAWGTKGKIAVWEGTYNCKKHKLVDGGLVAINPSN
jgi:hypothetical protein